MKKVFQNLDYLYGLVEEGKFLLPVTLVAPFISLPQAASFSVVCKARWPLFKTGIRPFFKWTGETGRGASPNVAGDAEKLGKIRDFPCGQWFDLHILANGFVTKCCIDESGFVGSDAYDVSLHHVLDIYKKWKNMRRKLPTRSTLKGCEGCYHLG